MLTVQERRPNMRCEEEVVVVVVRGASCDHTLQEGQKVDTEQRDHGCVSSHTLCWTMSNVATS